MEIKYLLKFTSKYRYAQDLMAGKLFMNQAAYFHSIEKGRGDVREATFSNTSMAYIHANRPIYCFYMAYNYQIADNNIAVDNEIFEDFRPKYVVVVDYNAYIERLKNKDLKTNYAISFGAVNYKVLTITDSEKILLGKKSALFYKHPYFSYQQEFRLMVYENLDCITQKKALTGGIVDVIDKYNKSYYLKNDLQGIAKIINVQNCNKLGGYTYIDLN